MQGKYTERTYETKFLSEYGWKESAPFKDTKKAIILSAQTWHRTPRKQKLFPSVEDKKKEKTNKTKLQSLSCGGRTIK